MTITQILDQFRSHQITATQALELLAPMRQSRALTKAIDEIIGLPSDLSEPTSKEREVAEAWEKSRRGE